MRENANKLVSSNGAEMWAEYHAPNTSPLRWLHRLKESVVCELFANRILSMSGPIDSALELGCGTGSTLNALSKRRPGRYLGVDRDSDAVAQARTKYPRISAEVGDFFNLPYADHSFDLVYSVGVLEHFTLAEQERLLDVHIRLARRYVVLMVPGDSLIMNAILFVNKKVLGRTGVWADEEVFSSEHLRSKFPRFKFDSGFDHRFGNLIFWFGLRPDQVTTIPPQEAGVAAIQGGRP